MILVTGGSGFIGSHFIAALQREQISFKALVHWKPLPSVSSALYVMGDLLSSSDVERAVRGCDTVVHIASGYRMADTAVDAAGTVNLVKASVENRVERFILLSTLDVITNPESRYSRSKRAAEDALMASGMHYCIVRPSLVYGPHDHVFSSLLKWMLVSPVVLIAGQKSLRRRPLYVGDLMSCLVTLLGAGHMPAHLNITGSEIMTIQKMCSVMQECIGKRRLYIQVPVFLLKGAGVFSSKAGYLLENLVDKAEIRTDEDIRYGETSFSDGIRKMLAARS